VEWVRPNRFQKKKDNPRPQPEIELSVPMPKFFDTTADRRLAPRTKLVEIAYIGMGPENGGLVLDVSDGGLSFHAVAPVQPAETIHFLLSLRGHSRIEGAGEIVWTNEMRTVCGLKFTSLSSGAREHLANWTNQSQMSAAAREEAVSPAPQFYPPEETEEKESAASEEARPDADASAEPVFAIRPAREVYLTEPAAASSRLGPILSWIMLGCLGVVLTVTGYIYGVHVGKSEISAATRSVDVSGERTETPAAAPAPAPDSSNAAAETPGPNAAISAPDAATPASVHANSTPDVATSIPNAAPSQSSSALINASKSNDLIASPARRPSAAASGISSNPQAKQASDAGKSELAAGLAYLNGDSGKRDIPKALQQLWKAVATGNAEAEVILADLYATGDGVAQNCEQAQVLLRTATKAGNAQAKVKLDEITTNGCQ
jgi:hypothetical protein